MAADMVLTNGKVYTVDAARSCHAAVAVAGGRIVGVGPAAETADLIGPHTQVVDLGGRLVLPGFIDPHMHASSATEDLYDVPLAGLSGPAACADAVGRFAAEHPELPAIRGYGWAEPTMPPLGPLAADLDAVVPDRPVLLLDDSYHAAWVNSEGLRLAGMDAATRDPDNGVIERLPNGSPSGTLREGPSYVAERAFPPYTIDQARAGILHFQRDVAGPLGLTAAHDAGLHPGRDSALEAFEQLQDEGMLTARFGLSLWIREDEPLTEQIEAAVEERARHTGPLVKAAWAKLFADGVIEGHTGVLKEPYADRHGFCGDPVWRPGLLEKASVAAAGAGFRLHYHAIGDAAVALCLDAIAAAQAAFTGADRRPLITHLQYVDLADLARFVELGVVAVPQPFWFEKDQLYRERQLPYLGAERAEREYPMRAFWEHGVRVASASDYPVPPGPDPLVAIQRGVLRRNVEDSSEPEPLWPEEAVTVEQMVESYTAGGAFAMAMERETGTLETGKAADLVVLSRDILTVPAEEITSAEVEITMLQGRPVFVAEAFAGLEARASVS